MTSRSTNWGPLKEKAGAVRDGYIGADERSRESHGPEIKAGAKTELCGTRTLEGLGIWVGQVQGAPRGARISEILICSRGSRLNPGHTSVVTKAPWPFPPV